MLGRIMAEEIMEYTNLDKLNQSIVIWATFLGVEMEDGRKFLKLTEQRYHSITYIVLVQNIVEVK